MYDLDEQEWNIEFIERLEKDIWEEEWKERKDYLKIVQNDIPNPTRSLYDLDIVTEMCNINDENFEVWGIGMVIKIDGNYILDGKIKFETLEELIEFCNNNKLNDEEGYYDEKKGRFMSRLEAFKNLTNYTRQEIIDVLNGKEINTKETKSIRESFEESLLREDVVEYYLSKTPEELKDKFGKIVERMVGFEQKNSHHCYDLWEHTLRTVEGIKPDGLTEEQFKKLRVAAFFHDIGKPDVSKFNEKTGQQVFYGHAAESAEVACSILDNLGYSEEEIEQLSFYIRHHDDFISYKSKELPYMKNHTHLRAINRETVLEKMIENQYDFEEMGYSKDEIRVICSTLAHDGIKPNFKDKDGRIIDVDMKEVQEKINSGEYGASYIPSEEDYRLLLELCKADAGAQSEVAIQQGRVVGSKKEKLENMNNIQNNIPEAYKLLTESVKGYSFEKFMKDTKNSPAGVIRPYITCKDGYTISVQANKCLYCTPEEDCLENYEEYEVRLESGEKIAEFDNWESDPTSKTSLYGYVPNEEIIKLIKAHGGLDKKVMKERVEQWQRLFEAQDTEIERTIKEVTGGNEYLETVMRYAARKIILEQRNAAAKGLLNEYEQNANKDGQTQSDE